MLFRVLWFLQFDRKNLLILIATICCDFNLLGQVRRNVDRNSYRGYSAIDE